MAEVADVLLLQLSWVDEQEHISRIIAIFATYLDQFLDDQVLFLDVVLSQYRPVLFN